MRTWPPREAVGDDDVPLQDHPPVPAELRCRADRLSRIAGFLRSGGVLRLHDLVYDCRPADAPALIERWRESAATDPATGYTAEDYVIHVRTEFSTYRELLDRLIEASGFEIADLQVRGQIYASYTCIKRRPPRPRGPG